MPKRSLMIGDCRVAEQPFRHEPNQRLETLGCSAFPPTAAAIVTLPHVPSALLGGLQVCLFELD